MQMINLKPAKADILVRLEDGSGFLSPEGQEVPHTAYWRRRIQDGDVVQITVKKGTKHGG